MTLREMVEILPGARLVAGDPSLVIHRVTHDSRQAGPGCLFVGIPGLKQNGAAYAAGALASGAAAVAVEAGTAPLPNAPWIEVGDARGALSLLASRLNGSPTNRLVLVGITGTNGKSTTAFLVREILKAAGKKTALVGTIRYEIGDETLPAPHTTPEAPALHEHFAKAVAAGCDAAVMEVSSHALSLRRADDCAFDVGVFTNLTQDHLDFHPDLASYRDAKRRLFEIVARKGKGPRAAVVNAEDAASHEIAAPVRDAGLPVLRFGAAPECELRAIGVRLATDGASFELAGPGFRVPVTLRMPAAHNVENALAAAGAGVALQIAPETIARGLSALTAVPGRFERVPTDNGVDVVVDYAHTPDALQRTLAAARQVWRKKLIVVFGCGGDRDRGKRPQMGSIAGKMSDLAIVTSDNPRSEAPEAICAEVAAGAKASGGTYEVVVDRKEAIQRALARAAPGDLVLIAGKGHEDYQILRDRTIPFSDASVVREIAGASRKEPVR